MEIWKSIDGYGDYQISSYGRVKSLKRYSEIYLRDRINKYGYNTVLLYGGGIAKPFTIHRLVAHAFIPNTDNKPQINHKNSNKIDNRVGNLEWMTASENQMHSVKNGRNNKHKTVVKLSNPPVIYHSIVEAASDTGINVSAISNCVLGKSKTSGGYKWKEYDNKDHSNRH